MRKQVFKFDYAEPAPISVKQIYIFHLKHPFKGRVETYRIQKKRDPFARDPFFFMA